MKKNAKNNTNNKKKQTVFVGMSGGVDSSVSAALLKQQGFDVVGVFIRTWHPDFIECNEEEEKRDAMRVCAHLDIPFLMFDFEEEYKKGVADYMIAEYKAGRTPNPDVMCNREVKFGAFMKKALEMGADFVATGHYAQNYLPNKNFKNFCLAKAIDPSKDQSYFLWTIKKEQLSKILFPIGHLKKTEVRALANKFKLPVANKKDSQGICFLGDIDLKDFLKHYIKEKKGKVVNEKGEVVGEHTGVVFSTLGERHGFTITKKTPNDDRYYVIDKDLEKNILIVSQDKNLILQKGEKEIKLRNVNFLGNETNIDKIFTTQIRYHGEFLPCTLSRLNPGSGEVSVILNEPILVASGQSVVVYDGEIVFLGGVVV